VDGAPPWNGTNVPELSGEVLGLVGRGQSVGLVRLIAEDSRFGDNTTAESRRTHHGTTMATQNNKPGPKMQFVPCLEAIAASPSTDPNFIGLRLTDDTGKMTVLGADLRRLGDFVNELLGAASHLPAPAFARDGIGSNALIAHHVEIATGANPDEAVITIFVGSMRLQFLLSTQQVLTEVARLVQEVGPLWRTERPN